MRRTCERVAGLDVHRDVVAACTQVVESGQVVADKQRFATTRAGLVKLAEWLVGPGVRGVVMEATGVYPKPVYYGLEGVLDELWLCNAHHLKNVPGRKTDMFTAEVVSAETGGDMARFPTPQQLCAWAGVAPADHEWAGKRRSGGTRPGGQWLGRTLIESARSAARSRDTYLAAQYRRIARRRGLR